MCLGVLAVVGEIAGNGIDLFAKIRLDGIDLCVEPRFNRIDLCVESGDEGRS
jgi:hypothetical protein